MTVSYDIPQKPVIDGPFVPAPKKVVTPKLYVATLYINHEGDDEQKNYTLWEVKTQSCLSDLIDASNYLTQVGENGLNQDQWLGYYVTAHVMEPLNATQKAGLVGDLCKHTYHKKKKTFLNGPNKDNEFLKKKGKHYV